jgi:hypothetical protein
MKRAALEKPRTIRTWRHHLAAHAGPILCECESQVGRFRKGQRIGGCRNPRCFLCHMAKLARIPKVQERRALAVLREGLGEVAWPNRSINPDAPVSDLAAANAGGGAPVNFVR